MGIRNVEWLNKNSQRSYPVKEGATQYDLSGSYRLVSSFIVDMVWAVDVHKDRRFFLRYLSVLPDVISGQLYDETNQPAATFSIDVSAHTTYDFYELVGVKTYKNCAGKLVVGELAPLLASSIGLFEFDLAGTEFEARTVLPHIRGVTSISKKPIGETTFALLQNHILFKDGFNTHVIIDADTGTIRIDAIEGAGLGLICDCPDEDAEPPCIAFINGIPGDASRNFNIRGIGCIEITGIENGIEISNTCVTNCCDCEDIDALEARVAALEGP